MKKLIILLTALLFSTLVHAQNMEKTIKIQNQLFEVVELTVPEGSWSSGGLTNWLKYEIGENQFQYYGGTEIVNEKTGEKTTILTVYIEFLNKLNKDIDIHNIVPGQKVLALKSSSLDGFLDLLVELTKTNQKLTEQNEEFAELGSHMAFVYVDQRKEIYDLKLELNLLKKNCKVLDSELYFATQDYDYRVLNNTMQKFSVTAGYTNTNGETFLGNFSTSNTLTGTEAYNQAFGYLRTPFLKTNLAVLAYNAWMSNDADRDYYELPGITLWLDAPFFSKTYIDSNGFSLKSNHYFGLGYQMSWEGRENTFINALPSATSGYYLFNTHLTKNPFGRQFSLMIGGTLYNGYENEKYNYSVALSSYSALTTTNYHQLLQAGFSLLKVYNNTGNDGFYLSYSKNAFGTLQEDIRYMLAEDGGNYYESSSELTGFIRAKGLGVGFSTILNGREVNSFNTRYLKMKVYSPKFFDGNLSASVGFGNIGKNNDLISFSLFFHSFNQLKGGN